MNIIWQYLDKRGAAIKAVKDYSSMQYILEHTEEEIAGAKERQVGLSASKLDGMPKSHNPTAAENRMVNAIEEINVLKERYRQAVEYMGWFEPAWEELSCDERFLLEEFYQNDYSDQSNAVLNICDRFGIERSSAYNRKNRALEHLTILLYGK